jgi:hypothetical protein
MLGEHLKDRATQKRKMVTFVYAGEPERQVFRKDTRLIRHTAKGSLRRTLRRLLGLSKVKIRSQLDNKPITTLEQLWNLIDLCQDPVFWVSPSAGSHSIATPTNTKQASQRDYSNHAILKLEHMVDRLDNPDQARSAHLRFGLVRENHRYSVDFVNELEAYFAQLDQTTTARWQRLSDCKRMCEDAKKDMAQFYKLRKLTDALSDAQQTHAQQYFGLINANSPLAGVAAENLIKLLMPDDAEWEEVTSRKNIFDEIRKDASQQG